MAADMISSVTGGNVFAPRGARHDAIDDASGAHIPILTFSLIVGLILIFGIELRCGQEIDGGGRLSINALIAFGAAGYDRIVIDGECWRALLAPLLHASYSHLIGNVIAMFFIGIKLEPLVGRPWFAAIFVLGALGGIAGSLIGNPHEIVTVGASGAISGLIGALFAGSFGHQAERLDQRAMRLSALRFGIPALGPLLWGARDHTDYHAHLGGALAGVTIVLTLTAITAAGRRPPYAAAMGVCIGGAAASLVAAVFAIHAYSGPPVTRFISMTWKTDGKVSEAFPPNYQTDPKARIARAVALDSRGSTLAAEMELRNAMALAGQTPGNQDPENPAKNQATRDLARTLLAIVLFNEGRRWEAWQTVSDICGGAGRSEHRHLLRKAHICEGE